MLIWVPTVEHINPQQSQQVALGVTKELAKSGVLLTVDGYYKQMAYLLSYREGASFMSTNAKGLSWVKNVTSGSGESYCGCRSNLDAFRASHSWL